MPQDIDAVLDRLRVGNLRFAWSGSFGHFGKDRRAEVAGEQTPWAVIVACSDSRVPVEAVFDVGVGDLFVVRTAGHVLAEASLASIRFAIEELGARTIVVLGHEDCGAVAAALAGDAPEWLAPITEHIHLDQTLAGEAGSEDHGAILSAAVDEHVRHTVGKLRRVSASYGLPQGEAVTVAGGAYELLSGEVHWLE
jgi:carbonic anhydrase